MLYYILSGINVDDLLTDWSKYCDSHNMLFGVPYSESAHNVYITSEGRSCNVYIADSPYSSTKETFSTYIDDLCKRHPDYYLKQIYDETVLNNRCNSEDDLVGFILK